MLLKPGKTISTKRCRQEMINFQGLLPQIRPEYRKYNTKCFCFMIMLNHTLQKQCRTEMRSLVGKYLHIPLNSLGSVRISFLYIDGVRICSAAFLILSKLRNFFNDWLTKEEFFGRRMHNISNRIVFIIFIKQTFIIYTKN